MYHLNSTIPSPYELSQTPLPPHNLMQNSAQAPLPSAFARGGRVKNSKMIKVHMNSRESDILDHLQGGREEKDGIKAYSSLEHLLKNPHIINSVHHHARKQRHHYAMGGNVLDNQAAQEGRYGDNQIVQIGPHTQHLFNQLATNHSLNPYTEYPEYWSLGPALEGIWNTVKGVGKEVYPSILPMAQQFLRGSLGGIGGVAASVLPSLASKAFGASSSPTNPINQAIGQGINTGLNAYQNGASAKDSFGRALTNTGQRLGNGIGETFQGIGSGLSANQPWTTAMRSGLTRGFNNMGGVNGITNAAYNTLNSNNMNSALSNQLNQYKQRFLPNQRQMEYNPYDGQNEQEYA